MKLKSCLFSVFDTGGIARRIREERLRWNVMEEDLPTLVQVMDETNLRLSR